MRRRCASGSERHRHAALRYRTARPVRYRLPMRRDPDSLQHQENSRTGTRPTSSLGRLAILQYFRIAGSVKAAEYGAATSTAYVHRVGIERRAAIDTDTSSGGIRQKHYYHHR